MFASFSAGFSKFLSLLLSAAVWLISIFGGYSQPSTETPIQPLDETRVEMTAVLWADSQVSNYLILREPFLAAAGQDLANTAYPLDALVIAGDVTENALECEYELVAKDIADADTAAYVMAVGNHDVRLKAYSTAVSRFTSFTNSLNETTDSGIEIDALSYSYDINGYRFIVLGTDTPEFEEAYFTEETICWLESELQAASQTGKPIFVILHQPLRSSHGLPDTWGSVDPADGNVGPQSDRLFEIFNAYDNLFLISGHLHTGLGEYTYEKIGNINSINLPSLCIGNQDGGYNDEGIGYYLEAYSDKVIFRARDFAKGIWLPEYDLSFEQ